MIVYGPGGSGSSVRTAPSPSACARSTCAPVISVTVSTACWTAQPSRVWIRARSPAPPRAPAPVVVMPRFAPARVSLVSLVSLVVLVLLVVCVVLVELVVLDVLVVLVVFTAYVVCVAYVVFVRRIRAAV
ncbi:hypothetical protein SANTM175S_01775 [Streptomyces antimycoticus]